MTRFLMNVMLILSGYEFGFIAERVQWSMTEVA